MIGRHGSSESDCRKDVDFLTRWHRSDSSQLDADSSFGEQENILDKSMGRQSFSSFLVEQLCNAVFNAIWLMEGLVVLQINLLD